MKVRHLGRVDYTESWLSMREFTDSRGPDDADELWVCEHSPVYTQGQTGKPEHILNSRDIPIIQTDRGGQVTYHGPGQVVVYTLINIRKKQLGVRDMVTRLEDSVIALLSDFDIQAYSRRDAPGVYVDEAKIAALGLRVRRGCTYHGIALNVDLDLQPFDGINPCGYENLAVTSLKSLGVVASVGHVAEQLVKKIHEKLEQHVI